jgi:hypothetical protein
VKKELFFFGLCLFALMLPNNQSFGQTHTFNNGNNTNSYDDVANWLSNIYPGVTIDVGEDVIVSHPCNINVDVQVNGLLRMASSLATLTVDDGSTLTVNLGEVRNQNNVSTSAITIEGDLIIGSTTVDAAEFINQGGSGGTTITPTGTVTFAQSGNFTNNSVLTVDGSFDLTNGDLISGGSSILNGTGTIANMGSIGGNIAPGNSVGTLKVQGDITPTGTVQIEVTNPSTYDVLNRTAASNLDLSSATVNFTVSGSGYAVGNQFTVFTNFDSYTGTPSITTNVSGLDIDYIGNGVFEIQALGALPVELVDFTAKKANEVVDLFWNTASELNSEGFYIQRSIDGDRWEDLGFVEGQGTSYLNNSYKYTDVRPNIGMNYYRLKQIDFDGRSEYSEVVSVEMSQNNNDNQHIRLFPNPTKDIANLSIDIEQEGDGLILIYDVTGKVVKTQPIALGGIFTTTIEVSDLTSGIYTLSVEAGQSRWQQRLVIE